MGFESKKELYRWLVQTAIAILTALGTALGVSSCVSAL